MTPNGVIELRHGKMITVRNAQEIARNVWLVEMARGKSGRQKFWWYATLRWSDQRSYTGWDRMLQAKPYHNNSTYGTVSGQFWFKGELMRFHNQVRIEHLLGLLTCMSKEFTS